MHILAIETTGPHCSVAVIDEKKNIRESRSEGTLNHLQNLTPMIRELLKESKLALNDIKAIAVSVGPGSFTGIRIGVSTGRALSQASGIKLIAVPTIPAFGYSEKTEGRIVCPIFDARRKQLYGGAYDDSGEIIKAGPYMLDEFLEKLERHDGLLFTGDGVMAYGEVIESWALAKGEDIEFRIKTQSAAGVAKMALEMYSDPQSYEGAVGLGCNELEPDYMRKAEAQQRLEERLAKEHSKDRNKR